MANNKKSSHTLQRYNCVCNTVNTVEWPSNIRVFTPFRCGISLSAQKAFGVGIVMLVRRKANVIDW